MVGRYPELGVIGMSGTTVRWGSAGALAAGLALIAGGLAGCGDQRAPVTPMGQVTPVQSARRVFGLVKPADTAGRVMVAPATERQPGGPETLVPVNVRPYAAVPLAPGVRIRVTAPIYDGELTDWLAGTAVTPSRFAMLSRQAERRYGPLPGRARMFRIQLDEQGRVSSLQQIFSP